MQPAQSQKPTIPKVHTTFWHYFGYKLPSYKSTSTEEAAYTTELRKVLSELKPVKSELWLTTVYNRYSDRFSKDNEKIWATAAIFIPLSLAGLIYFNSSSLLRTILLAAGSIKLMEFWVNIAENHRAFQNKSQAITRAIELNEGFNLYGVKLDSHPDITENIQNKRWMMLYYVRRIWFLAVAFSLVKSLLRWYYFVPQSTTTTVPSSITSIVDFFI